MSNISFRPAIKSSAKLLIGLYSESGCGKTFSALLLARGFVGSKGTIAMIETESGRGEAYADTIQGGYSVLSLRDDFSPAAYGEAISAAEKEGFGALIIDSASHEWEGIGGVLDMAARNEEAGKKGLLIWQKPKISHSKEFMLRLMQTSIPLVIVCMRAKYPMEGQGKDMKRSKTLEPKQSADILFEMMVHGWVDYDHNLHITKPRSLAEDRTGIISGVFQNAKPITIETGSRLAAWADGKKPEKKEPAKQAAPVAESEPKPHARGTISGDASEGDLSQLAPLKPKQEDLDKMLAAFAKLDMDAETVGNEYGKPVADWTIEDYVEAREWYKMRKQDWDLKQVELKSVHDDAKVI